MIIAIVLSIIVLFMCVVGSLILAVLGIRNQQVFRYRTGLLRSDYAAYLRLPSSDEMCFRFWRPLSSFLEIKDLEEGL